MIIIPSASFSHFPCLVVYNIVCVYVGAPCNLSGLQASTIIFVILCIVLAVALVIALVAIYRPRRGFVFIKSSDRRISLGGPNETHNRLINDGT